MRKTRADEHRADLLREQWRHLRLRALLGAAVQRDRRLPHRRAADLDLTPADAANTQAEHLRDRLLRGPAAREVQHVVAAVALLPLRVHARQEARVVALEHAADA